MNKKEVVSQIIQQLEEVREFTQKSASRSHDDMIEAESAMQSRYSSAKEESEYLANSLFLRLQEVEKTINQLKSYSEKINSTSFGVKIDIGSIVFLYENGAEKEEIFFILPVGGGISANTSVGTLTVITPESPIGKRLIGLMPGVRFDFDKKDFEVVSVY